MTSQNPHHPFDPTEIAIVLGATLIVNIILRIIFECQRLISDRRAAATAARRQHTLPLYQTLSSSNGNDLQFSEARSNSFSSVPSILARRFLSLETPDRESLESSPEEKLSTAVDIEVIQEPPKCALCKLNNPDGLCSFNSPSSDLQ